MACKTDKHIKAHFVPKDQTSGRIANTLGGCLRSPMWDEIVGFGWQHGAKAHAVGANSKPEKQSSRGPSRRQCIKTTAQKPGATN